MKIKCSFNLRRHLVQSLKPVLFAMILLLIPMFRASGANLFWDAGNTNNGGTIDSASGFWDVTYFTTNFSASTTTTTTNDANLGAGGIDWFQVNVPINALAATNTLLYATNLPVNVWFSANVPPTTTNAGDTLLMQGVTGGVSVLTTNLASAPTNIVPGGTYYIGIDNSSNNVAVGYALKVDLSLTNAVTITNQRLNWNTGTGNVSWTQTAINSALNGAMFTGPDAPDNTYQVVLDNGQIATTNLTITVSGYTFSGSPLYYNTVPDGNNPLLFVADGKSVIFSNNITGNNNTHIFQLGSNGAPATMTVHGTVTGMQPLFTSTNGSVIYLAGGGSWGAAQAIDADVRLIGGTWASGGACPIARSRGVGPQPNNSTGSLTIDGSSTVFNQNNDYLYCGRDGNIPYVGTLIVQNGATLNINPPDQRGIGLPRPSANAGANCQSRLIVSGGTINLGSGGSSIPQPIWLLNGNGAGAGQTAVFTQSGGTVNAWGGISLGGSGTFNATSSAMMTNSGGFLYLGSKSAFGGIGFGATVPPIYNVSLSGGTVGALQNWISAVPMTLATLNGNITFQAADSTGTPWNISLSGALTGPGGFYKSGGGVLTLSGANNYAGLTAVSNGTLVVSMANLPQSGDVVLDGSAASSAGLPILSNLVVSAGQSWTMTNFTVAAGTPTVSFQFGSTPPSTTVAPIQANGNVTFTVTPNFTVDGAAIPTGTYPLIHYTGTYSGPAAASLVYLPAGGTSGYVTNITATKTVALYINSTVNPFLKWAVGNGLWDIAASLNWKKFGIVTNYHEGDTVEFDDTASGTSPITVTLNSTVNPGGISALNATKAYIISGTGAIAGAFALNVSGAGSLTLSNANTYSGGTTVSSPGQLNINYGGNGGASSAIGTNALNLNMGAKLDNTSGHDITLNTATPIPMNWNADWTFVGSGNLGLGLGQVTLGNNSVVLTVVSNTLTVNNHITESSAGDFLVKQGNGSLTLSNANTFTGGFTLIGGTVNINADGALGSGVFDIAAAGANVATFDNTSGSNLTLVTVPSQMNWAGNIAFKGTTNLDLGAIPVHVGATTLTLGGSTLTTEGALNGNNGPGVTVNGSGTWDITGAAGNNALAVTINGGTVLYDKIGGNSVNGNVTTVNTNGTLVMGNAAGVQMNASVNLVIGGGTVDMKGDSESIAAVTFNSGALKNSAPSTASTLGAAGAVTLSGSCVFDVAAVDSTLTLSSATGSGGLIKSGLGLVTLTTNGYTGNTTVSNGTLVLNFPTLATNSTVTVNTNSTLGTNGVLTLNFSGSATTNVVAALVLGGVSKPAGVYNSTTDPIYLAGSGSLQVVPLVTINPLPAPIQFSVSGNTLALSWPTNLGWILQSQTNSLSTGLTVNSNAWSDVSGSGSVTSTNITINRVNPTVFFRLRLP